MVVVIIPAINRAVHSIIAFINVKTLYQSCCKKNKIVKLQVTFIIDQLLFFIPPPPIIHTVVDKRTADFNSSKVAILHRTLICTLISIILSENGLLFEFLSANCIGLVYKCSRKFEPKWRGKS